MSDANARGVGEIFGAHERFTAKTGKHQAHQLGASRFDGQTRGKGSGSGEIIYPAGLAISLKQFLNCVPRRGGHQTNYAPAEREKKRKYSEREVLDGCSAPKGAIHCQPGAAPQINRNPNAAALKARFNRLR